MIPALTSSSSSAADLTVSAILPIGAAILFLLFSPLLTSKVVNAVDGWIAKDAVAYGAIPEAEVPPHLTKQAIVDYVEYAADAVQIVPATLLPVVGAIVAVTSEQSSSLAAVAILVGFIAAAVGLDAWVLSRAPQDYVSRKLRGGYSIVSLIAIACNVVGIIIIGVF